MTVKQQKTEDEIAEMIRAEMRKHPECKHIYGIGFTHQISGGWEPACVFHGSVSSAPCANAIREFVEELGARYDLKPNELHSRNRSF